MISGELISLNSSFLIPPSEWFGDETWKRTRRDEPSVEQVFDDLLTAGLPSEGHCVLSPWRADTVRPIFVAFCLP